MWPLGGKRPSGEPTITMMLMTTRRKRRTALPLFAVLFGTALLLSNQLQHASSPSLWFAPAESATGRGDGRSDSYDGLHYYSAFGAATERKARNRTSAAASYTHPQGAASSPSEQQEQGMPNRTSHDDLLLFDNGIRPRAFAPWDHSKAPLPCEPVEFQWRGPRVQKSPTATGLLLVKTHKTASSTSAGVTLRMAQRIARRRNLTFEIEYRGRRKANWTFCQNRVMHVNTHSMGYENRDKSKSFLWSVVRDPTARAISHYFHVIVSRRNVNASDDSLFIAFLQSELESYMLDFEDFQIKYLSFQHLPRLNRSAYDPVEEINHILANYDFLAVTERLDESLVAMQMLLGLDAEDVAHVSAKTSGGYDGGGGITGCALLQKSFVTPGVQEFLGGPEWQSKIRYDAMLHRAANASLDMTIDLLGRDAFLLQLERYRTMQHRIQEDCSGVVRMPCDFEGNLRPKNETDCLVGDSGCGFDCIDASLARHRGAGGGR